MAPTRPAAAPVAHAAAPTVPTSRPSAHFGVRLSFTMDESNNADAFIKILRREGFDVVSTIIPHQPDRWPGVAYFYEGDRDTAILIAGQLRSVTGQAERARHSTRRPYSHAGIIEVSLLKGAGTLRIKPKAQSDRSSR
ncbi:MAG TPA: hypothetical protein VHX12_00410 [Acidisoma sp.]|jgi:hypothetical protein|nr:hypothetical protein [Acidisoma sp.]